MVFAKTERFSLTSSILLYSGYPHRSSGIVLGYTQHKISDQFVELELANFHYDQAKPLELSIYLFVLE